MKPMNFDSFEEVKERVNNDPKLRDNKSIISYFDPSKFKWVVREFSREDYH